MLGIIDYGMGNIFSIKNAAKNIGLNSKIVSNPDEIINCSALILPGVGAFGHAINKLNEDSLIDPIREFINTGKYILGICLGMQLLVEKSYEFDENKGIGVLEGECKMFPRFVNDKKLIIPHTMWNQVKIINSSDKYPRIFENIPDNSPFYFVHSFYVNKRIKSEVIGQTDYYDLEFCSAFQKENTIGVQFHPEKSGKFGLQLLTNFKNMIS